jgi:hypothetical protein
MIMVDENQLCNWFVEVRVLDEDCCTVAFTNWRFSKRHTPTDDDREALRVILMEAKEKIQALLNTRRAEILRSMARQ